MRQKIVHGGMIDAATTGEVADMIEKRFPLQSPTRHHREKGSIPLDGTGAGTKSIDVPSQYDWILERVTIVAAAAGIIQFFENAPNPADLLENIVMGANGAYSDSFDNRLWVPANSQIVIVVSAGGNNLAASYNLQVQLIETP